MIAEEADEHIIDAVLDSVHCCMWGINTDTGCGQPQQRPLLSILQRERFQAREDDGMIGDNVSTSLKCQCLFTYLRRQVYA